jgi:hypothetical protein
MQAFLSRAWTSEIGDKAQQDHDDKIEAEIYRRNKVRRTISRIVGEARVEAAKAVEGASIVAFDTAHVRCTHCIGRELSRTPH